MMDLCDTGQDKKKTNVSGRGLVGKEQEDSKKGDEMRNNTELKQQDDIRIHVIATILKEALELLEKRSFRYTDAYVEGLWPKVHEIAERLDAVEDEISKLKSHRLDLPIGPNKQGGN
jgi:hypothetical protein